MEDRDDGTLRIIFHVLREKLSELGIRSEKLGIGEEEVCFT